MLENRLYFKLYKLVCFSLSGNVVKLYKSLFQLVVTHHFKDMVCLVTSVLTSLLRRDMSLNRRLFSWLLGSEINPEFLPGRKLLLLLICCCENDTVNDTDSLVKCLDSIF